MGSSWRRIIIMLFILPILLAACEQPLLDPDRPVTLTFWHVYGSVADSPMNDLITRFNRTLGREKGIIINVTSTFTTSSIHAPLVAAARGWPGAGALPDMFMAYPRDALAVGPERLLDWRSQISPERLDQYVPEFLNEGSIDGRLVILPVAKSTSALFVNGTIFEEFSKDTGIGYESLDTWEGLFKTAEAYYQWSGGKAFFKHDDWLHYFLLNTVAFGGSFLQDEHLDLTDPHFQKIWKMLARAAVAGHICLMDGYATTAMLTGETLCGIESSASILYYKDFMTLPDNTRKPLRLKIRPVPNFKNTQFLAIQRGSGLAVCSGDPKKEYAATVFAEWLTNTDINVPFVVSAGYLPVKIDAYKDFMDKKNIPINHEKERELYTAVNKIYNKYHFCIPPYFTEYGAIEKKFNKSQHKILKKFRDLYKNKLPPENIEEIMMSEFVEIMK